MGNNEERKNEREAKRKRTESGKQEGDGKRKKDELERGAASLYVVVVCVPSPSLSAQCRRALRTVPRDRGSVVREFKSVNETNRVGWIIFGASGRAPRRRTRIGTDSSVSVRVSSKSKRSVLWCTSFSSRLSRRRESGGGGEARRRRRTMSS